MMNYKNKNYFSFNNNEPKLPYCVVKQNIQFKE